MMKKHFKLLIILSILISLFGCAKAKLNEEDFLEIDNRIDEIRNKLIGKVWHYKDNPTSAIEFLNDGSIRKYQDNSIKNIIHDKNNYNYEIKYCDEKGNNDLLESDPKEEIIVKYDYYLVVHKNDNIFVNSIAFDNEILKLADKELFVGNALEDEIPEDLELIKDIASHIYHDFDNNLYYIFFKDGKGLIADLVYMDGTLRTPKAISWGTKEDKLYIITSYENNRDVDIYDYTFNEIKKEKETDFELSLIRKWDDKSFSLIKADKDGDLGLLLFRNLEKLRRYLPQEEQ